MRYNLRIDRRNTRVSAPTFKRPWKPLRTLEQCLLWFTSVKRRWMISLSGKGWAFFGSPDILKYEVRKSPMGSRLAALLRGFLDPSRPWGSLGEIYKKVSVAGWPTSTGPNGEVLVIPKSRLESLSRDVVWVPGQNLWPLIGFNPGRRYLYLLGLLDSPLCRKCGVGEETSAHILCECEALDSLRHVYLGYTFVEPEDIWSLGLGAIWNYSKVAGLPWFDMGHKGPVLIKA